MNTFKTCWQVDLDVIEKSWVAIFCIRKVGLRNHVILKAAVIFEKRIFAEIEVFWKTAKLLIFCRIIVNENRSIDIFRMRGKGNINKIRFGVLEDHYDYFCSCQLLIFVSSKLKIICSAWYGPKSIKFGKRASNGDGFDVPKRRWPRFKIHLCPNLEAGLLTR